MKKAILWLFIFIFVIGGVNLYLNKLMKTESEVTFNKLNDEIRYLKTKESKITSVQWKEQLEALNEKYTGKQISARMKVVNVTEATFTKGIYIRLKGRGAEITIPIIESSPYLNIARQLNKGQTILFKGKFKWVSWSGEPFIYIKDHYREFDCDKYIEIYLR